MAASANSSGNQQEQQQPFFNGVSTSNPSTGDSGRYNNDGSGVVSAMKHNPGISADWTAEEQAILDEGLAKYNSDSNIIRYAKIALMLPSKTVRDVALRCRWLNKKEVSKRRKEDHSKKNKEKREKVTENASKPSHVASRPGVTPFPVPAVPLDIEDGITYEAIGGPTGELLKQNQQFFEQISSNFNSFQLQDNVSLLCQARDNLAKIINSMSDSPEIMKQMPPLPVKVNDELANTFLPRMSHQMQS